MTEGHKHRTVVVGPTFDVWWVRLLRMPLFHTTNVEWADRSRLVFGPCGRREGCWYVSTLGFLHAVLGLVLKTEDPDDDDAG